LAPIYESLGKTFEQHSGKVIIAKVDADKHRDLGNRFGVRGYPTLLWFPKGKTDSPEKYSGKRDLKEMGEFIKKQTGIKINDQHNQL